MKTLTFRFPNQDRAVDFSEEIDIPCVIRPPVWVDVQFGDNDWTQDVEWMAQDFGGEVVR